MHADRNESDYAWTLAQALRRADTHRHVPGEVWDRGRCSAAFDVELCDAEGLPAGFIARVIVTVSPR